MEHGLCGHAPGGILQGKALGRFQELTRVFAVKA